MLYKKLSKGDIIGFFCPGHIANPERYERNIKTMETLGYRVKLGESVYKNTYGYLASRQERADDFNTMIANDAVKMILFGGGDGSNEIIPLLDYENIKLNPKFFCSFSDGTSILNAIYAMTGLPVYYGQGPGMFHDLRYYDYLQFLSHFDGEKIKDFSKNSEWINLRNGDCEGTLI